MNLKKIFFIGIIYRIIIFTIMCFYPINHDLQGLFGPLVYQNADLDEYLYALDLIFLKEENVHAFINNYIQIYYLNFNYNFRTITGPIYPLIIFVLNYKINFPYLLSIFCFFCEILCYFLWLSFLNKKINNISLIIFSLLPIPLIFGLIHSSDIIYYLISTLIILRLINNKQFNYLSYFLLFIICLLRPAGISILVLVFIYDYINNKNLLTFNKIFYYFLFIFCILFYLPYFIIEINSDKVALPYYFERLNFIDLSLFDDSFLKKPIIILLKFFFLFGFDPTESGWNFWQWIRRGIAVILLLGFFNTLFDRKIDINKIYIWMTVGFVSFFLYPTYRYLLPVLPLLYLNFYFLLINLGFGNILKKIDRYF